jgi:hypothetical protein
VEVADLLALGNARDLVNLAVVSSLHLVRMFNDFADEVAEVEHEVESSWSSGAARSSSKIIRRYALSLPSLTLWQLTKVKFTRRESLGAGAVLVSG